MDNHLLRNLIVLLHFIIWSFVLFGSIISIEYAEFNVLYLIPIIYLSYVVFNDCLLNNVEYNVANNLDSITLDLYNFNNSLFHFSYQKPLSSQGMLILGFIIGIYILKYNKN